MQVVLPGVGFPWDLRRARAVMSTPEDTSSTLEIRSTVHANGTLELSLVEAPIDEPSESEVVVRMQAAPLNPSDLGLLFAMGDVANARASGTAARPVVTAEIPESTMKALAARVGHSLPVGNEGAGLVVKAGASPAAQALLGRTVAVIGGGMYTRYRKLHAGMCLALPEGTSAAEGASCFVNPLTALGMVETMKAEGHSALVHTAAASNLGQMLVKLCRADAVPLVNVVRRGAQAALLREVGAEHVCDASAPDFRKRLTDAISATGATIGFDAVGGGELAGTILGCMEAAASRNAEGYSRYGSTTHKQVYIYGALDRSPTVLRRNFGFAWGVGGWLLTPFLQRIGAERAAALRERVAREVKTTFASRYAKTISLAEALSLDAIAVYGKQATGEKYLVDPSKP